ncbi:MAG: hypothetical protein ACC682_02410 [Gemmatimonadota bacterium]
MAVSAETDFPTESKQQGDDGQTDGGQTDAVLRAKYADFCSAQLTEVFLSLSDDRIYELVEEEARLQQVGGGKLGFRTMVKLATKRLRDSVPLPDYETWKHDYQAEPERYERYLLGLWEPLVAGSREDPAEGEGG